MAKAPPADTGLILDAAERLVADQGVSALSITSVSRITGITNADIRKSFRTREKLIAAVLDRWIQHDARNYKKSLDRTQPRDAVQAHLAALQATDDRGYARASILLATLVQSPDLIIELQKWYRSRLGKMSGITAADRQRRLALLAGEGVFFLRFLDLYPITSRAWDEIFADLHDLIEGRLS